MVGGSMQVEQGVMEGEKVSILFGEEAGHMEEDGFEGSKEENQVFMDVFYGSIVDCESNIFGLSGNIIPRADVGRNMRGSIGLNCETTSLMSYPMKDSPIEAFQCSKIDSKATGGLQCFAENISSWADAHNWNNKRKNWSSMERLHHKNKEPRYSSLDTDDSSVRLDVSKVGSSDYIQTSHNVCQQVPCRIVESFGQSILPSCYVFKRKVPRKAKEHHLNSQEEICGTVNIDDDVSLHSKCTDQHIRDGKVVMGVNSVTSTAAQGTFSAGLLMMSDTAAPEETPGTLVCVDQTPQESGILNSEAVDVASKKAFRRELPTHLHSQSQCLLLDAGWKIEPRKRSDRTKMAFSFIAPEGLAFRALSQAWRACGERLLSDAPISEQDENKREWMDIDVFWGDLADTLSYIEETRDAENSLSLLHRWKILDPFMTVVLIDRRISALREGKALRTGRTETFLLRDRKNKIPANKSVNQVGDHLSKPDSFALDTSCQSLLPVIEPDCNSEVFEGACNQQVLPWEQKKEEEHRHGQVDRKPYSCGEIQKRSLKSLARRIGKGLHNSRCLHSMNLRAPVYHLKKTSRFSSKSNFLQRGSCSLYMLASPLEDVLPQGSVIPDSETSTFPGSRAVSSSIQRSVRSGSNCHSLVGNESRKRTNIGQQMRVLDPKEKILLEGSNKYCKEGHQGKFADVIMPDAIRGINLWPEMQSSGNQSLIKGVPTLCKYTAALHNLDFSNHKEFSPVPQEETSIAEKLAGISASKSEIEQTSTEKAITSSIKKVRKKSKKISEIEATNVNCKDEKIKLHDGTSRDIFDFSMSDGISDPFVYLFPEEEDNTLMWETAPEHIVQTEYLKQQNINVAKASETVQAHISVVAEASSTTKKPAKFTSKAARQNGDKKINFNMPLQDKLGGTLLNEQSSQENLPHYKLTMSTTSQQKKRPRPKKVPRHLIDFKESALVLNVANNHMESHSEGSNEVLVPAIGSSPEPPNIQKITKSKKAEVHLESGRKRPRGCHIDDDDLLIAAILKNKDFSSGAKRFSSKLRASQSKASRKLKSQQGSCKLLLRTPGKGGKHSMDGRPFILGTKTVLCWLIEMGTISLKDVAQFRNPKTNEIVKDGLVTRDGILCKCCTNILSVSDFKAHAGFKLHKPSLNLFLQSGQPYTLCQLQAWSVEYKARKGHVRVMGIDELDQNDDTCGLCGDGGELICCDNCPSTYHQACLPSQEFPEGSWYCSNCICEICRDVANQREASSSLTVLECSQCEHKYHDTCIKEKVTCAGEVGSGIWFCGESCQEVYLGLRSRVGVLNNIGDGFSWTILRCNHDDQKVHSAQKIAALAECNSKLAIALTIMEECFLPMVDPRTGIDMIPHVLYNWRSNLARLNYQGFYTVVLEKGDEIVSVASIRLHGVSVAEMPLIATCSEHRRQGMCRRMMNAIEKMLKSFKVKMLVLSAIPSLVETWTSGFGFIPIEDEDKQQLKNANLMLFPGTSMLKKNLCEVITQATGPTFTSSSGNKGGNNGFYLREDQSKTYGGFEEKSICESGQRSAEKAIIGRDANSLLPFKMNLPGAQVNSQQSNLLPSCDNHALTDRRNEHGKIYNAESFIIQMKTSNTYETDQFFSTEQAVSPQMSIGNIHTAVHSCSRSLTPARNNDLLNVPSATETLAAIGDTEENLSQKISILTENTGVGVMKKGRITSDEVEDKRGSLALQERKNDCCFSDELTRGGHFFVASNVNKKNLGELNLSNVLVDSSTILQDEICGSILRHPVAKGFTPGNVEA